MDRRIRYASGVLMLALSFGACRTGLERPSPQDEDMSRSDAGFFINPEDLGVAPDMQTPLDQGQRPRGCEGGSTRCSASGDREICNRASGTYMPYPCLEEQGCAGEGECVARCLVDPDVPCRTAAFSPTELPHTPSCFGEAIAVDDGGWVAIGDPCANPPDANALVADGAVIMAKFSDEGALGFNHVAPRGAIGDEAQLGHSIAMVDGGLLVTAPGLTSVSGASAQLAFIPEYGQPEPEFEPCYVHRWVSSHLERPWEGSVIAIPGTDLVLLSDPAGDVFQRRAAGSAWLLRKHVDDPCKRRTLLPVVHTIESRPREAGLRLGSAIGARRESSGENQRVILYVGIPGAREGAGLVQTISLVIAPNTAIINRVEEYIAPEGDVVGFGEQLAVGERQLYISAPRSSSNDARMAHAPLDGNIAPSLLPWGELSLEGYSVGEQMKACGDQLWVVAESEDEAGLPLLLEFTEEEGAVLTLSRKIDTATLGLGLTSAARLGASIACYKDHLLVGAPGAPGGGSVIVLSF